MVSWFRVMFSRSFGFRVFLGFVAAALSLTILVILAYGQFEYVIRFDEAIRVGAQRIEVPWLTNTMMVITRLGSTLALTVVGIAAMIAFIILGWRRPAALFLLAMAGQIILHHGFKILFARQRPEPLLGYIVGDSYSFPSGHAIASLTVYGILSWLITRRIQSIALNTAIWVFATLLVMFIGFSRIYFGVHNATDVIAGFLGAFIWTASVASGDRPRQRR